MPYKMVMRDNDKKYPKTFDDVFTTPTCKVKRNVTASPNLEAHVERVIQTLKHEVLNGFCVVNEQHLGVHKLVQICYAKAMRCAESS